MAQRSFTRRFGFYAILITIVSVVSSCLPTPPADSGGINITLYAFSIMKESLEKGVCPGFVSKWKQEHGQDVRFTASYAGSETITNQILQGVPAEIAILSIDRDAQRLKEAGFVTSDWHALPHKGIINKTPFVILVKGGNPKAIHDFPDLAKPGIRLIHPDPVSSGGAQWSILAMYGSELMKAAKLHGEPDQGHALLVLQNIWKNVFVTPASAREARTTFELGNGDALVTYELEGLLMKHSGKPMEIIVPKATIFSEHPAVVVDRNVPREKQPVINAFMQYLWSDEAQQAFVKNYFYSVTNPAWNEVNAEFGKIEMPFTIDYFGGWDKAYPDIIENIFKTKVQSRK